MTHVNEGQLDHAAAAHRTSLVRAAIHSAEMEGGGATPEAEALWYAWARGEISEQECDARIEELIAQVVAEDHRAQRESRP